MDQNQIDKYYHGFLTKRDVEPLLKNDGDFLIRKTDWKDIITLSLDVCTNNGIKHFMINQNANGDIYIEKIKKKTINELIKWYLLTKTPLTQRSQVVLKNGIPRPNWLVNNAQVKMIKKLGEGAFGEVYCGEYTDSSDHVHLVAIKTMHDKASRVARFSFLKEARIMRKFDHPNITHIFGVVADQLPLLLLMELCEGGSTLSFLRKNRGMIVPRLKLRFITESASGLQYLEKNNCIHRDIAARNCLLTRNYHIKLSDFGMSDEKTPIQDKSLDKVPIKWLAPETMQNRIYSTKTDVWSYGIMVDGNLYVWEVYSEGCEPYPSLSNIQTRAKIIVQNYRMDMPQGTPPEVTSLVSKCWAKNPNDRPSFAKIYEELKGLIDITEITMPSSSENE
uniref:Tyrosine-protein kinase n=1 Tax=Elaeophora elaphi TaxID=1147741 RepID=A0A0R3RJC0_9BILA